MATVEPGRYMEAVEALEGTRQVFCDGETILLPGAEVQAIEMLRSRFNASTAKPVSTNLQPRPKTKAPRPSC